MSNDAAQPIKMMYVIGQLTVGGTEMQLLELVRNLNPMRYKILLACLSEQAPLAQAFSAAGCEVRILHREKRGRLAVLMQLRHLVSSFQPDIVHSFAYASRAAIPISKLFPKAANVVSIRTQPGGLIGASDHLANAFADCILTNSQKAAAAIRFGILQKVPCHVIYNGIDLHKLDGKFSTQQVSASGKVVCAVARLHPVKRLDVLLEAFAIVIPTLKDAQLWIVGDGAEKENLQRRAAQLGITANVTFWGEQQNIPAILQCADLGVLSSQIEGLSNAILEYMAARLPVVATDVGGNPELVLHRQTGLLVPVGNAAALAEAMLQLLTNGPLARQLGQAGRERVERFFTINRMVSETEAVYENLLAREK